MYLLYLCTNVTTVPNRYIVLFADIEIQIGQHELSDDEKEFIINVLYFGMDPENSQSDLAPTFDMQFTPSHSNQPRSLFDTAFFFLLPRFLETMSHGGELRRKRHTKEIIVPNQCIIRSDALYPYRKM